MSKNASIGVDLYGRDVSASKALKTVGDTADRVGHKMVAVSDKIIKGMALAATATAAAAVKIGIDSVQAAMEDQQSTDLLTKAIHNSTRATVAQSDALQAYVDRQQLRLGVDDSVIRQGLGPLLRVTHSTIKAQHLMNTALNVSAMSGKGVGVVSLALSKAYNGNFGALTRLGISIDKATLKSKDFGKVLKIVDGSSRGFADRAAATMSGKMARVAQAFDKAKESLGYMLMDALTPYMDKLTASIPKIEEWIQVNGPKFRQMIADTVPKIEEFLGKLGRIASWAMDHKDLLENIGKSIIAGLAAVKVAQTVSTILDVLNTLRVAYLGVTGAASIAGLGGAAGAAGAAGGAVAGGAAAVALPLAAVGYVLADSAMKGPVTRASRAGNGKGQTLAGSSMGGVTGQFAYGAYAAAPVHIHVHAPSLIDKEGFLRALNDADRIRRARRGQGS